VLSESERLGTQIITITANLLSMMAGPTQWSTAEKEKRLRRLFEKTQQLNEEAFLTIEFGDDALYQYWPPSHNISGRDDEIERRMAPIIDRYDLVIERSSSDRTVLDAVISIIGRMVRREPHSSDDAWMTVAHKHPESAADAYTVFTDIYTDVFSCDLDEITDATIAQTDQGADISWKDI
jgi:hypothetical protein